MKISINNDFRDSQIAQVDVVADKARYVVVGDAARIAEYQRAEQQATDFKAANYQGDVPSTVQSWATAKNWTAQQACDDILAASVAWYAACDQIRALRLKAKEDIRNSTSKADADNIFNTFQTNITQALQEA